MTPSLRGQLQYLAMPALPTHRERLSLPLWTERYAAPFAPTTAEEMAERGWDAIDVVFVTGDAYVDHPSFAMAILHRVLERAGFRVAMLSQPNWKSCEPWRQFGRPRLFFAISAGNMDSLINHYTANKKVRNDDAYSPGGRIGLRPDRATLAYCHRAREAFPGVPIIAGGVEASLRRLAHYDYWSDTVKRSILLDAKADLIAYGMGEATIVEIAKRLQAGKSVKDLRDLRGVTYALGASESQQLRQRIANQTTPATVGEAPASPPPPSWGRSPRASRLAMPVAGGGAYGETQAPSPDRLLNTPHPPSHRMRDETATSPTRGEVGLAADAAFGPGFQQIPSFEDVRSDKLAFAEATRIIHTNTNPFNAATLVQFHDRQAVVQNPPALPLSQEDMDSVYGLPYTRRPHPSYTEPVPAHEMIKDSVTVMRGCFGGCTFCSITAHQGRIIQSRSEASILEEVNKLAADPD